MRVFVSLSVLLLFFLDTFAVSADTTAVESIWSGNSGIYHVEWTSDDINVTQNGGHQGTTTVFTVKPEAERDRAQIASYAQLAEKSQFGFEWHESYKILSLVGPYLSVETNKYCDCGGAHPSESLEYQAFDLSKSTPEKPVFVDLTELFSKSDLLNALLKNKIIARNVADPPFSTPATPVIKVKTLADLDEAIWEFKGDDCGYTLEDSYSNFAFHHLEGDKVAVEIGFKGLSEACRGMIQEIQILLPVPTGIKKQLGLAAQQKEGFLMEYSASKFGSHQTEFEYYMDTSN